MRRNTPECTIFLRQYSGHETVSLGTLTQLSVSWLGHARHYVPT